MMQTLAARFAGLPRWGRVVFPLLAGAMGGLAQQPYNIPLAILVSMVLAMMLCAWAATPKAAARYGWLFGTGYFLVSLTWIMEPFYVDIARHGWMAPFALVLLAGGLALFWGLAFGVARIVSPLWALVLTWPLAELTRAYIFTGFPWAMPPQATVDVMAGQALAWVGPHGLMLGLCLAAWIIATPLGRWRWAQAGFVVVCALLLTLPPRISAPVLTDQTVRLVQPNAAQHEKWDPEKIPVFMNRLLDATAAEGDVDLIIWPETALPYLAHNATPVFEAAAERAAGMPIVLGIQRYADPQYFNSLVVIGAGGAVTQTYDKHHLVPFGEYLPFSQVMRGIGLRGLAENFGGGYGAGPGPALLDLGALGTALPLICYEAVFAHDVFRAPTRPGFLLQITNDAWFGKGKGPKQHLAQARMRAIEQGLPMARAANTGISAMIGPRGQVLQALDLNTAGHIDAALPMALPPTPYSRTGDMPLMVLLMAGLVATALRKRGKWRAANR